MCTKISGQALVMRSRLEFNPLASRLMHLWDWVQEMGGDLTACSQFRTSCCLHKGDMLDHVCDFHHEKYAK